MDLIVYAHPDSSLSHNASVLKYVQLKLNNPIIIDLHKDNFNPILQKGVYDESNIDAQVKKYQELISKSNRIIVIHPVWWMNVPAILKGFYDRVLTPGFAFNFTNSGYHGLLNGKKAIVISTFGAPHNVMEMFQNSPVLVEDKAIFEFCGLSCKRVNWFEARAETEIPNDIKMQIDIALK